MAGPRKKPRTDAQERAFKAIQRSSRASRKGRARFEEAVRSGLATGLSLTDAAEAAEYTDTKPIRHIRDKSSS